MSKCIDPKGHLFEQQKLPKVKVLTHFFCATCGEVQQYDPLTKTWSVVKEKK